MKTLLPWLLAFGFAFGATYFYTTDSWKGAELATLRQQVEDAQKFRPELESSRATITEQEAELARLKKEAEDTQRLRNDIRVLREEKLQLSQQLTSALSTSDTALQQAQQLKTANQELQSAVQQKEDLALLNTCLHQLRLIDVAKQEWALAHKKAAQDQPTSQDLAAYLKNGILPVCPAGGTYTVGAVAEIPACTLAGHTLQTEKPVAAQP